MSSGQSKKDYLGETASLRNANSGLINLAHVGEDSSALASLVVKLSMLMGNANEGSKGAKGFTAETASILTLKDGHLALVSLVDFAELFDKDETLCGVRETIEMRIAKKESLEVLHVAKMNDWEQQYDVVAAGGSMPGWPMKMEDEKSQAGQDAFNKRLSSHYVAKKNLLDAEHEQKLLSLKAEYGCLPESKDEVIAKVYKDSAKGVLRALEMVLTPTSFLHVVNVAAAAGLKHKSSPPPDVLACFVKTINSFAKQRTVIWLGRERDEMLRALNDGELRNAQEHSQHFTAISMKYARTMSLENPALLLYNEVNSVQSSAEFIELKQKYNSMPYDSITLETVREFYEELGRSPATKAWARKLPTNSLASSSTCTKQTAQAARVARVDTGQETKKPFKCHKCGETGHMARDCENDAVCYNCGETGHLARECPRPPRTSPRSHSKSRPGSRAQTPARRGKSSPPSLVAQVGDGNAVGAIKPALKQEQTPKQKVTWKDQQEEKPIKQTHEQTGKQEEKTTKMTAGKIHTVVVAKNAALAAMEHEEQVKSVKIDTGADVTVCEKSLLQNLTEHDAEVISFDGKTCRSNAKGILHVLVADKDDQSITHEICFEAWACEGIGPTPLISWKNLSAAGAEMHLSKGKGSTLDLKKLGGPKLRIHEDGRLNVVRVMSGTDSDGWQTVSRTRRRSARAAQRFAPRQTVGARAKNE